MFLVLKIFNQVGETQGNNLKLGRRAYALTRPALPVGQGSFLHWSWCLNSAKDFHGQKAESKAAQQKA